MFSSMKRSRAGRAKSGTAGLSFIGAEMTVSGNVASAATIHVDGRVEGNVGSVILVMGEGGIVAGNIDADQVRIAGLVDGAVRARTVTLEATARVTGDVTYETLSIAAGAQIEGRLARQEATAGHDLPARTEQAEEIGTEKKAARKAKQAVLPALETPALNAPLVGT